MQMRAKGVITALQRDLLALFASLPDQQYFYLTGGTALAEFYLGHRLSFDLDFFTSQDGLIQPFSYQLEKACENHGCHVTVVRRFATFVQFTVDRGDESHKIDLALDSPFRFESTVQAEYGGYVNDFADLKVDKLLAYFGRAEPRDAIDLHFLMQIEPLDVLLELAPQKDPGFDLYWFAVALNRAKAFPDELERWPVKMLMDVDPVALKQNFQSLAAEILSRLTSQV
ncbi:MAG: nucleotidyl transferase AbiEii/AbiGii toxin family protein [Chloroflexi bacterium]|nr:nucleotidyl transferase AbiEii/AbiGii toxin family protein [Chloroflexota bacterium]